MVRIELVKGDIDVELATFVLFSDSALRHFEDALGSLSL